MNALTELIKKIGIFMIAAQAVIHFAPEIKYAKYMKLIVGIMILLQFLSPVYRIVGGMEAEWSTQLSDMEREMEKDMQTAGLSEDFADSYSLADTVVKSMEQEIKFRLNNNLMSGSLSGKYVVTSVTVSLERVDENNENAPEYLLNKIRVVVREHAEYAADTAGTEREPDAGSMDDENVKGRVEKVQIDKINITPAGFEEESDMSSAHGEEKTGDSLRKRFCNVLGMDEKYMEVRVYGALEETAK